MKINKDEHLYCKEAFFVPSVNPNNINGCNFDIGEKCKVIYVFPINYIIRNSKNEDVLLTFNDIVKHFHTIAEHRKLIIEDLI